MADKYSITIDLSRAAEGTVDLGEGHVIQKAAMEAIVAKLEAPVPAEDGNDGPGPAELGILRHRSHDTIVVDARRGEGKTTFLLQLLTKLRANAPSRSSKLYSLGILDPTLIETKQNLVIMVVRRIQSAVLFARKNGGSSGEDDFAAFQASLTRLAAGLPVLDGIGRAALHGDEWADPEYVMESGLDHAGAATLFETQFRMFMAKATKFLNCDAFVLAIDDVDTSFEKGWPVLEAIRKYFTTPRLKIVLSGDLELYAILVRRRQWEQIGGKLLKAEGEKGAGNRAQNIESMVDALQDQYLIK